MSENLPALQPQPTLFSTPGARLHFGNLLPASPCSQGSTCGCVHAACSRASLPALPHAEVKQLEKVTVGRGANGPESGAEQPSQPPEGGCKARQREGKGLSLIPAPAMDGP